MGGGGQPPGSAINVVLRDGRPYQSEHAGLGVACGEIPTSRVEQSYPLLGRKIGHATTVIDRKGQLGAASPSSAIYGAD